ncbi:MAG TPA: IS5 family transposase [Vicinamibacterales bacterium]|nr:IS5 family transposase [Vicinamibacterales bacterium]
MSDQRTFAGLAWDSKKKVTRRERFLAEMEAVIPWTDLVALIAPHYPKSVRGRPAMPLATMLRLYFLQHWFNLSDPAAEEALYDSEAMRRFARVELGDEAIPDETTILHFRHLLEQHQLPEQLFALVRGLLETKGLLLKAGTIVDATIITAPTSTKNATAQRDPEMRPTRKGNTWYFGMKVHVGTDRRGIVHALTTTDAATADVTQLPQLLHGEERALYGDQAYWNEGDRQAAEAAGVRYRVNRRGHWRQPLTAYWKRVNQARSRVRARGEHAFHVVKTLWGAGKVRYRGLAKNTARMFTLFALVNLYLLRYRLGARQARCLR